MNNISMFNTRQRIILVASEIAALIEWGVVNKGDIIVAKGRTQEAELQVNGQVKIENDIMYLQQWLKKIFSWSSVATYEFSVHKKTGKTLSELRQEYMEQNMDNNMVDIENINQI